MKTKSARKGATTVEFALVVPLVMLLVLGMMEWGRFEMVRQVTSTATFNAARLGSIPGSTDVDVAAKVDAILDVYFVSGATTTTTFTDETVAVHVEVPVGANAFFLNRFFGNITLERDFILKLEK